MKDFFKSIFKSIALDIILVLGFFVLAAIFFFMGGADLISAQATQSTYRPLATIPGFTDQGPSQDLGTYVNNIYQISIALGAVAAIMMIVIGGMQYMGTDIFSKKGQGRERITNALLGLGLLLVAFLILNTLNNDLIDLDVDLRKAVVQGKINEVREALSIENLDEYLEQEKQFLADLAAEGGRKKKVCSAEGFGAAWNYVDTNGDAGDKQEAISILTAQEEDCGTDFVNFISDPKNHSKNPTRCVAVFSTNGLTGNTSVVTCFYHDS